MKHLYLVIILAQLFFIQACSVHRSSFGMIAPKTEENVLIRIECRDEKSVQQLVIQALKTMRIADWDIRKGDSTREIMARYWFISPGMAEDIKQQLIQIPGVLDVEIKNDGMPVKNPFL